ncbi:hypothetical protein C5Y96_01195 [Blastopirellula marina]|uniref:Uncharacterized protein n=1 Tax=Blastopirellula marina TaxID=124 RepID=A0A2S8G8R3_9BACT|nr:MULTISPECIES: hypothetical protein [Pirellulaceae]PQO40817.1 hypothetical protein C5Y96_01195 [Blastopirellula marina]RCS56144.1 hypothetical protein DTL36_01195 [Bremerella cremea]
MTNNFPPHPSSVLAGFAIIVIGSCVVPIGWGIEAQSYSDPVTNQIGLVLLTVFGTLAFAQYVAVFRCSRWFASLAIVMLVIIVIATIALLLLLQKAGPQDDVEQRWILGIAGMALIYACTVVLTYRWQTELLNAPLSERTPEPAKNLKLFDLFAITTFAAGLMAYLATF